MGQRITRVNELIKREVNDILRTKFRSEAVSYTVIDIKISPDLRNGTVFYSVLGDDEQKEQAKRFFKRNAKEIRFLLGKRIILKYMPFLKYQLDNSMEKGSQLIDFMDEIDDQENE